MIKGRFGATIEVAIPGESRPTSEERKRIVTEKKQPEKRKGGEE